MCVYVCVHECTLRYVCVCVCIHGMQPSLFRCVSFRWTGCGSRLSSHNLRQSEIVGCRSCWRNLLGSQITWKQHRPSATSRSTTRRKRRKDWFTSTSLEHCVMLRTSLLCACRSLYNSCPTPFLCDFPISFFLNFAFQQATD